MKKPVNKINVLYLLVVFFIGVMFRGSPLVVGRVVKANTRKVNTLENTVPLNREVMKNNIEVIADRKPIIVIDKLGIVEHLKEV